MSRIGLVACSSSKLDHKAPAEELYSSSLFTKSRLWVKSNCDRWYILSAKYGLLEPEQEIEPYNITLNTMRMADIKLWSSRVLADLQKRVVKGDEIVFLAGEKYRKFLVKPLLAQGCIVKVPLEGLPIGKQLQWLLQN
jgi:cytoplasmic iron level regulating protein YaaA (DUF328/UPF0246 family)